MAGLSDDLKDKALAQSRTNILKKLQAGKPPSAMDLKILGIDATAAEKMMDEVEPPADGVEISTGEYARIYGAAERTVLRWKKSGIDLNTPVAALEAISTKGRMPAKLRSADDIIKDLEALTGGKIAANGGSAADGTISVIDQINLEKLRKIRAEADKIEFVLHQAKGQFVSLADDVAPALSRIFEELFTELEGMIPELGELCDLASGNEIMATGEKLLGDVRDRCSASIAEYIKEASE